MFIKNYSKFPTFRSRFSFSQTRFFSSQKANKMESHNPQQVKYMEEEYCIRVDKLDNILPDGSKKSKKECHLMENIDKGWLHRAFSTFLFDEKGRLLLQQRASEKITFPDCWTNTVCSHPLYVPEEMNGVEGVKLAAQRKLQHELNIEPSLVPLSNFKFLTKILYKASSDGKWGEHEVDYILFIKCNSIGKLNPNPNEVRDYKYVTKEELEQMVQDSKAGKIKLTPWFSLINNQFLYPWWDQLLVNFDDLKSDDKVHDLTLDS